MIAVLYVSAVSAGLGALIWFVLTRRTDPVGYSHIANCSSTSEAERATKALERHGIRVRLDDHSNPHSWGLTRPGPVRVLVPDDRMREAVELLRSHVAAEQRERYMRLV